MTDAREFMQPANSASGFRRILDGFAKPGTRVQLPEIADCPSSMNSAAAAIVISLCDYQTPVWLARGVDTQEARAFIRFHTGAPLVSNAAEAAFAILGSDSFSGVFSALNRGTDEYPDRAATAIIQVPRFSNTADVVLDGPGIKTPIELSVGGFNGSQWKLLAADRILFPRGVDAVFVCAHEAVAIPRSTRIQLREKN